MKIYYTHSFGRSAGESHSLLSKAIALYTGDMKAASRMVSDMRVSGKPSIDGFDSFSISHSEGTWAVLISGIECGLDIQHPRRCDAAAIADRFYAPRDAESVRASESISESEQFFRIWVRREALIKAAGTSVAETDVPAVFDCPANVMYEGRFWKIADIEIPGSENIRAAVCLEIFAAEEDSTAEAGDACMTEIEYIEIR